jgi:hypothetical protein
MAARRWLIPVLVALMVVVAGLLAGPGPATGKPRPTTTRPATTTTLAATTTTTAAPTTTLAPTTTTGPPSCPLSSTLDGPSDDAQAAVNATPSGGCLTIDRSYPRSSPLQLNRPMTVQCVSQANGFTSAGTWELVHIDGVTGLTFSGCSLTSTGPTSSAAGAVGVSGNLTDVTISGLQVRNVQYGIAGSPTVASMRITGNDLRFLYATGIGLYGGTTRNVEIDHNTVVANQRSGQAGQAGIQTGGIGATENLDKHSGWSVHDNTVDNSPAAVGTPTGCGPGDLVDMGFDQLSSSTIQDNTVRHCLGAGEGLVVVGPNNIIRRNQVYDKGQSGGAYVLISYGTPPQQNKGNLFEGNLADGIPNSPGNQGLALSFGPGGLPIQDLVVRRFTAVEQSLGVQSYAFQGSPDGLNNRIEDSNPGGAGPNPWCGGLAPLDMTVVNTPNCPVN